MGKKKSFLVHKIPLAYWVIPFLLAFLIVADVCLYIWHMQHEPPMQTHFAKSNADVSTWNTYTNGVGKFTLEYPSTWVVEEHHEQSNRVVDDSTEINTAVFRGKEGEIVVQWGPMGFGGGCDDKYKTNIQLKDSVILICGGISDNQRFWSQIYAPEHTFANTNGFGARATAASLSQHDAQVIEKIFSTISFKK